MDASCKMAAGRDEIAVAHNLAGEVMPHHVRGSFSTSHFSAVS